MSVLLFALALFVAALIPHKTFADESVAVVPPQEETDLFTLKPFAADAKWARESVHSVRWVEKPGTHSESTQGPYADAEVAMIAASYDGGKTWEELGSTSANDRRFLYTVPASGPAQVRLRVTIRSTVRETKDIPIIASQKQNYTWKRILENAPWGGRDGVGSLVYKNKMWVIGGWTPYSSLKSTANDVWSSTDGVRWTLVKPNTFGTPKFNPKKDWEGRHTAGYQVHDGKMWIVGGDPLTGYYQTDVWNSTDGKKWTRVDKHVTVPPTMLDENPDSPTFGTRIPWSGGVPAEKSQFGDRALHITGSFKGKLWVMGGQIVEQFVDPNFPGSPAKVLNDVWSSKDGATWTKVATKEPMWSPRGLIDRAVTFKNRMWVIGGGTYDDPGAGRPNRDFYNDVWSTADGVTWAESEEAPFRPREYHNVIVAHDRIWVIAGVVPGVGNSGDAWYTADGKNWYQSQLPDNFIGSHAASVWAFKGALYYGLGNTFDFAKKDKDGRVLWRADIWKVTRTKK